MAGGERWWKRREADRWRTERSGVSDISNSLRLFIFNQEFAAAAICILALFALEEHPNLCQGPGPGAVLMLRELLLPPRAVPQSQGPLTAGTEMPGHPSNINGGQGEGMSVPAVGCAGMGQLLGMIQPPPAFPTPGCNSERLPEHLHPRHGQAAVT